MWLYTVCVDGVKNQKCEGISRCMERGVTC